MALNNLYLATATLLLLAAAQLPSAAARGYVNVNPFCRTSNYRRVCSRMVNGATTLTEASANAINATRQLAVNIKGFVPMVKPFISYLDPKLQDSIMNTCVENFDNIIDDMEVSAQAVRDGDIGTARSHLSAAFRSDCEDALKEAGVTLPEKLGDYTKHLSTFVDNCLAVLMQN